MKKRMRSALFFLCLCAAHFIEGNSFSLENLFGGKSHKPSSSSSVHTSSDVPTSVVLKLEHVSSDEDLESEYNVSLSSLEEMYENSSETNWLLLSGKDNTTEYVSSSSSVPVPEEHTDVPIKSDESTSDSSSSSESSSLVTDLLNVTQSSSFNSSAEEQEEGAPSTFTVFTKTIYQKTIEWAEDTYTLSILIPVAAGILFAVSVILTIVTCRCMRRTCRRRRFRKRVLPDSIKDLRPADRARLLGDCNSSDEEF